MRFFHIILSIQTVYYLFTGIWALVHIKSFMQVTGYKTDIWLVKTISFLLLAVSFSFMAGLFINTNDLPVTVLAISCCLSLAAIDFYYALKRIISPIYLADGILQLIFLAAWIIIIA